MQQNSGLSIVNTHNVTIGYMNNRMYFNDVKYVSVVYACFFSIYLGHGKQNVDKESFCIAIATIFNRTLYRCL